MSAKRIVLLVGLMAFFLTGCIKPVKKTMATEIPTNKYSTELSENISKDVIDNTEAKEGYVTFWFDDGLQSTYEIAYPQLAERGWKAVTAVISNREVAEEKFTPDGDPVMSWDQIEELYNSGWEISSHSQTHPRLNEIEDLNTLQREIIGSKQDLESMGYTTPSFTFPYGHNGLDQGQKMISNNYLYWRSSVEEINPVPAWRHITSFILTEEVNKKDIEEWVKNTEESGGWLVIMMHGIVESPGNIWQHTQEQFEMVVQTIQESSLEVALPSEMYSRFGYAEGISPILFNENFSNLETIGIESFQEEVFLEIPTLKIEEALIPVCEEDNEYDFSILHEAPVWICPEASPYLKDIGSYGASIILGHRQWGPIPKIFAKLDKLQKGDIATITDTEVIIDFNVIETLEINPEDLWGEIAKYYVLGEEHEKSFLILITCTPYGTDDMRLLVILERSTDG